MATTELPLHRVLKLSHADAIERAPAVPKEQGFGVLTTIDVKTTLKAKLGVEFPAYTILGACNPTMAHKALTIDPTIGVNMPCNVIVRELGDEGVEVRAVDPIKTIGAGGNEGLAEPAQKVREMLAAAIAAL